MDRLGIQEAIMVLKPLCDSLMKDPNVNSAKRITGAVNNLSEAVVQDLLEYILFPLSTHLLDESLSKNVKEELVKTLEIVLTKARIKKLVYFDRLYSCLLIQIYDKSQANMVILGHEELKETVLSCMKTLLYSCFTEVIELLYTRQNSQKIGQGILLAIKIARSEKSRSLRLTAIRTVMALCQIDDEADRTDITLQDQVADVITLYLPGIASGLQEIAMGSETQGHKVTVEALKAWGKVLSLVMQDKNKENCTPLLSTLNDENKRNDIDIDKVLKSGVRSPEWYKAAARKLNILVQELDVLKNHSHYKVRKQLAESIYLLLETCSRNMEPNVVLLVEYLISLSEDDVPDVKEEAQAALHNVNSNFMQNGNMRHLVELLEENFYDLLTRLPRIVRRSADNEQLACLNQLAGYIKLFGEQRLPRVMISTPHIRRLLLALVYVMEIDCSNISLLQTINVKDIEDPASFSGSHLWRRFKFIQCHGCSEKVMIICKFLGEFGDLRILTDNILSLMSEAPQHRKELTLLLNWIMDVPFRDESLLLLYKDVIEYYISDEIWYPPIEVGEDVHLRAAQSNVVQCCLLIEGIGSIALNLRHHFDKFLLKTLYLVIERAGSGHSLISFVGTRTLEQIAESQAHKSVGDLLRKNVDFISYHVTVKLRRVERNAGVLDVVGVVMKYSTMDVLPCLKEIVEDALVQLRNSFQRKNSYAFLKVFYIFIISMRNLTFCNATKTTETELEDTKCPSDKVIESLLQYCEAKRINEKIDDYIKSESETNTSIEELMKHHEEPDEFLTEHLEKEEEKKPEVPSYVKMIEQIMNRCLHFLPSKDIQQSLAAMSTLQEGFLLLADWEDQLLPIVHLVWHPLVDRFHDANVLIINRAWQLLNVLARVSKDFIRSRTLKQVLPALSKFLGNAAKESYGKTSVNMYKYTQMYKLQKELLSTLAEIAKDLKLRERELWDILSITEPYLSRSQHPVLQECCVKLYTEIASYNSDITWVKCLSIWHSRVSKIPGDASLMMEDLTVTENTTTNEFSKNVQVILKSIQESLTVET